MVRHVRRKGNGGNGSDGDGSGIGCYFDDPVHEVFGIKSRDWQCLYHFTVGGHVEDVRLTTLPPYAWQP